MIVDFHTHRHAPATMGLVSIESVDPRQFDPQPGRLYSVGLHPWHTLEPHVEASLQLLARLAAHPQVVAIGETGLDPNRGAALDEQQRIMQRHIAIAEQAGKPLVLHMVRTSQLLLKAMKQSRPSVPWVLHGFRSRPTVEQPLVDAGFYFSIGPRFNAQSLQLIPPARLLIETDDSPVPIAQVAALVAQATGLTAAQVAGIATRNALALLRL